MVSGESSFEPAAPTVAEDDLELYRVGIPAFTLTTDDVNASYINNQRYTMSDIGNIEQATFSDNEFNTEQHCKIERLRLLSDYSPAQRHLTMSFC